MKRKIWGVFAIMLLILSLLTGCAKNAPKSGENTTGKAPLTVKVFDIGQGDAILIRAEGQTVLVDTGDIEHREKMVVYLKKENITTIDKVIITHPHADHLGGMPGVLENFKVGQIYDCGKSATTKLYKDYLGLVKKQNIPFTVATPGSEIALGGDVRLKVLAPDKSLLNDKELNNSSVVVKLIAGQFSMLLTGDAEKESEEMMLKNYKNDLKADVLKAGHHGSSSSSSVQFLKAVGASDVVISLGANNDYHHPHPSTLKRYAAEKMNVYQTDKNGTLTITSDGKTYKIAKERE